ncbi:hypothetical protein ACGFYT_30000 [Streptomyces sp. NPDC048208]|uniref:hypothetical protein n=1 Tax=Streptomyces sp. NPDC048208 TaxID=3365515 RepID=UPI0037184960
MAFYLVTDGRKTELGEADTFVVRAGGRRQALAFAPVVNRKDAEVIKLEDGRDVPNGVILASLVDFLPVAAPAEVIETVTEETAEVVSDAPRYAVI